VFLHPESPFLLILYTIPMKPTPYEDINQLLEELSLGLQKNLGDDLIGFYFTGSLTYGDFNRESSDIDFLVVTKVPIQENDFNKVQKLHETIGQQFPEWKKRLEGSYVTEEMLQSTEPPKVKRPYVNAGKMWQFVYGNEWIINKYALYTCGKTIYGSSPHDIMKPVTIEQVREASKRDLQQDWLPKVNDPQAFCNPDYDSSHLQAYAALTLCRILYRQFHDDVSSKKVAAAWVKEKYPEWRELIEKAESWKHGYALKEEASIKKFITFVISKIS